MLNYLCIHFNMYFASDRTTLLRTLLLTHLSLWWGKQCHLSSAQWITKKLQSTPSIMLALSRFPSRSQISQMLFRLLPESQNWKLIQNSHMMNGHDSSSKKRGTPLLQITLSKAKVVGSFAGSPNRII